MLVKLRNAVLVVLAFTLALRLAWAAIQPLIPVLAILAFLAFMAVLLFGGRSRP